ncbi:MULTISPECIES: Type 1 glutamine amidotransferase-like domain-containing protein [unclassified Sporosarcina]|uniref:Type 1 glutamine amidotransferase-like domain-containing protein n=1 Tax=unclassified Sporosarcina TaxID=2647733 RepID=UPI002041695C|nr:MULTISPECIES: Type 1 glutamine amidotransferase-like domain-containing protein [unclassified Sporosarcina]
MLFSQYNFHESWAKDYVRRYINPADKVLIIPFSFSDSVNNSKDWDHAYNQEFGKFYQNICTPFLSYSIQETNISWLNYFLDSHETAKEMIKNSDIIFLTGGLPDKSMDRLREFGLLNEITNYTGVIIGSSAGAMIQLAEYHITPDKDYASFSYNKGLNLLSDFDIEIHYEGSDIQNRSISKVLEEKADSVFAIGDSGGMIAADQEMILFGDTQKFSSHKLKMRN